MAYKNYDIRYDKYVVKIYQIYCTQVRGVRKLNVGPGYVDINKTSQVSDVNTHLKTTGQEDSRFKLKK